VCFCTSSTCGSCRRDAFLPTRIHQFADSLLIFAESAGVFSFGPAHCSSLCKKNFLHIMHSLRRRRFPCLFFSHAHHSFPSRPQARWANLMKIPSRRVPFDCFLPEILSCVCLEGTRCRANPATSVRVGMTSAFTAHGRHQAAVRWDQRPGVPTHLSPTMTP
jgi:hypothetical protein